MQLNYLTDQIRYIASNLFELEHKIAIHSTVQLSLWAHSSCLTDVKHGVYQNCIFLNRLKMTWGWPFWLRTVFRVPYPKGNSETLLKRNACLSIYLCVRLSPGYISWTVIAWKLKFTQMIMMMTNNKYLNNDWG